MTLLKARLQIYWLFVKKVIYNRETCKAQHLIDKYGSIPSAVFKMTTFDIMRIKYSCFTCKNKHLCPCNANK